MAHITNEIICPFMSDGNKKIQCAHACGLYLSSGKQKGCALKFLGSRSEALRNLSAIASKL